MIKEKIETKEIIKDRYEIIEKIGDGGWGAVFRVRDLSKNQTLALKICLAEEATAQKRFIREVKLLENLKHKNVIPILDSQLEGELLFYVMPLAKKNLLELTPALLSDEYQSLEVFMEVLRGVYHLHKQGILHRDIKPNNILVLENDRVVISDFGLAKSDFNPNSFLTATGTYLGTSGFMAPEQLDFETSKKADQRTDIYQLGKTLYCLLTNDSPHSLDLDKLSNGLKHIVETATRDKPENRFPDILTFMESLKSYRLSFIKTVGLSKLRTRIKFLRYFLEKDFLPEIEVDYLLAEFNSENKNPDILINAFLEINNSLIENIAKKYPAKNLKLAGLILEKIKLIAEKKYYNFEVVERFGIKILSLLNKDLPIGKLEYLESLLILAISSKRYATLARIRNWLYRQSETETVEFESVIRKYLEELAGIGFLQKLDREKLNPKLQEIIK